MSMATQPIDDDAEAVLKQELTQHLQRLDALDRERAKLWERIDKGRKDLAKVRGSIVLRIETLRQELLG
jgi:uncharacterized protein (UPF0335 family)